MDTALVTCLYLFGPIATCCFTCIFQQDISEVFRTVFASLVGPFAVAQTSLLRFWAGVRNFYRVQFADDSGNLDLDLTFLEIIGAFFYTACFAIFGYSEFNLMSLTLEAMGIETGSVILPFGAGVMTVIALMASMIFYGSLLIDLVGMSKIAPWRERLSEFHLKVLKIITVVMLIVSLIVAVLCGLWRGMSLAHEDYNLPASGQIASLTSGSGITDSGNANQMFSTEMLPEGQSAGTTLTIINVAIPTLFLIGGALSGYGLVMLIKYVALGLAFVLLMPVGAILIIVSYLNRLLELIYGAVIAFVNLLAAIGRWLLSLINYTPPDPPPPQAEAPQEQPNYDNDTSQEHREETDNEGQNNHDDSNSKGFNPYDD